MRAERIPLDGKTVATTPCALGPTPLTRLAWVGQVVLGKYDHTLGAAASTTSWR